MLSTRDERVHFAAEMLRQTFMSLKALHDIGYSHGDLKPSNICVREDSQGRKLFTLIDFGVCQSLEPKGNKIKNKSFRGNLMFCSDRQLEYFRPRRVCDLLAVV